MKRRTILIPLVLLAGCTQSQGLSNEKEIVRSFEEFDELSEFVRHASSVKLYEGLPNEYWEPVAHKAELANKSVKSIDSWHFYAEPVPISPEAAQQLRTLTSDHSLFTAFGGPKSCGGFHSDWCLVWANEATSRRIHLCFGCDEMMAFEGDKLVMLCDLKDSAPFEASLQTHRWHRPTQQPVSQ